MTNNLRSNIPNLLLLLKPNHFGFNIETAKTNHFQNKPTLKNVQELVLSEFNRVIKTLEANKITVKVFADKAVVLPDAIFPNNWITAMPNGMVTVFPMFTKNRRREVRNDIIEWISNKVKASNLIDLTLEIENNRFLEGTGSIVFDHFSKIAFACESNRTSIALFEEYCKQIGYQALSFTSVDLKGNQIYHTNVMLSIAKNYCLINIDSIQNISEQNICKLALEKNGKQLIPISNVQMNHFAGNVLEVMNQANESCLIMSTTAYDSLNTNQLEIIKKFSKIITVNIETIEKIGGGGIRCMLAGLFTG